MFLNRVLLEFIQQQMNSNQKLKKSLDDPIQIRIRYPHM